MMPLRWHYTVAKHFFAAISSASEQAEPIHAKLDLAGATLDIDVYEPPGLLRGVVFYVHGMTPAGKSDPRQTSLCKALAACGFRVVAPEYTEITQGLIRTVTMTRVVGSVESCLSNPRLCPDARLSLLGPCLSGTVALIAACDQRIASRVASICTIGAIESVARNAELILNDPKCDLYARLVFIRSFTDLVLPGQSGVHNAIEALMKSVWKNDDDRDLESFVAGCSQEERRIFVNLVQSRTFRADLFSPHRDSIHRTLGEFGVSQNLHRIQAAVLLIHGAADPLVPPDESSKIHQALRSLKKRSRLVLTPLLTHGDLVNGPRAGMLHRCKALRGLAFFMREAATRRRASEM